MIKPHLVVAALALAIGAGGLAHAQGAATSPAPTTPPEQTTAPTTMNNPATANTPPPGSTAAMSTPGTAPRMAPAGGTPSSNNAVNTSRAPNQGAPVSGANSFTSGQARARIQRHGFSHVTNLKLDQQGIWRARAMRGGKTVSVALDYQGNVVAK